MVSMDLFPLVITVAALVSSLYALKLIWKQTSHRKEEQQQKKRQYAPIAGSLLHQLVHFRRHYDYLTDLTRRNKTFRLFGPTHDVIFTADPTNVEYILATNFSNYGKGILLPNIAKELLGRGIFAVDGENWRYQRKLASFEFSTKVLRDFSSTVFRSNAARLAQVVSEAADGDKIIDIQELLMKSTMDSIFKIAFGVELNCLSGNEEGIRFTKAFDDSSEQVMRRLLNPFWKISKFLNIGTEATYKENIKVIDDFIYQLISTKMKEKSSERKREDILSRFLLQREKDPKRMNDKYLRDIILNFVIAGKDTTAGTLSWFLYMLCKHPNVQKNVAQEVMGATNSSNHTSFEDFSTCISEEVIHKLQYLHATLSETLRLYPAVPITTNCLMASV